MTQLTPQEIRSRLKDIQSLPTLPPIVSRLNEMVADQNITATKLGEVIEKDQVLTSKLLKMVNSSFFGFPQRIGTVSNALVLLGFNVIKTLIVTSSIFEVMQAADVGLFKHSLGTATAAGIIARRKGIKNPEEISTAGLIHDLGKIVVRAEFPELYQKIIDSTRENEVAIQQVELEVLGMNHEEIGGIVARQWNLPDRLTVALEYHHRPDKASDFAQVAAIIHFSDILVTAVGFGDGGDPWVPALSHTAWEQIKFSRQEMKEILEELDEKLVELENFTMDIREKE